MEKEDNIKLNGEIILLQFNNLIMDNLSDIFSENKKEVESRPLIFPLDLN